MKFATVAACPVFGGKLANVDDSKAMAIKGVRQVVRLDNAVAVVGDHMWAAMQGLAALDIDWDDGPNAKVSTADIVQQMETDSQKQGVVARKEGDVAKGLAGAAKKIEAVYEMPFLAHAAMEPMNCTVHVREDGCDIWVGIQVVSRAQATAAQVTGLPPEKVQVHNHLIGGGFGRRLDVDGITQAVAIAKQVDGPVKIVWSREEDIQHDVYRPYYYRPDRRGPGCRTGCRSPGVIASPAPRSWRGGFHRLFKDGLDFDAIEGARKKCPMRFPTSSWTTSATSLPASRPALARRRTHAQYLRSREFHRRAGGGSKEGSRRIPPGLARQIAAHAWRAQSRSGEGRLGQPLAPGVGRGVSRTICHGHLSLANRRGGGVQGWRGQRSARRLRGGLRTCVNPDTIKAQIEGGIIFGISAALWGEITLKNGRVEQHNFNDYRVLRINETPLIEVHLVKSTEAPGGIGEPGTIGVARDGQCDLRRNRQAHPQVADQGSTATRIGNDELLQKAHCSRRRRCWR